MDNQPNRATKFIVSDVILAVALIVVLIFALWAFKGRSDYKNNVDQKISQALSTQEATQKAKLQQDFDNQAKLPYKTYKGLPTYGSITFNYPKTWSAYVDDTSTSQPINGYFYPDVVPAIQSDTAFALRLQLVNTDYTSIIHTFDSAIKDGSVKASAYLPPKMNGVSNVVPGTRLDGAIGQGSNGQKQQGSLVVIKVRDKTLEISTQSNNFLDDYNNSVLANLTFAP